LGLEMKPYLMSLAAGVLVGAIYGLINIRSPAPPVIALVGLLGILVGEQMPPLARMLLQKETVVVTWLQHVQPHMFGHLPRGRQAQYRIDERSAGDPSNPVAQ
jgi:XapX domain-containing protein